MKKMRLILSSFILFVASGFPYYSFGQPNPDGGENIGHWMEPKNITLFGHFEGKGDIDFCMEGIFMAVNDDSRLEGFGIKIINGNIPEIEYQAVIENSITTPWVKAPAFCGTKGQSKKITGISIRFVNPNSEYSINYRIVHRNSIPPPFDLATREKWGHDGQMINSPNANKIVGLMVLVRKL